MNRLARVGRSAMLILGTGYVLHFFSETVFWSTWRADTDLAGRMMSWFVYGLFGYLTLAVIRFFRVADIYALVLAGAFFGWATEGIVAMTVFGDPSMPFPLTIAWTALAWHGPLSVVLGWYCLGFALREQRAGPSLVLSLCLGAFWGLWALGWQGETPPIIAEPVDFLLHAAVMTFGLALGHVAIAAGRPAAFAPSRWGVVLALLPVVAFFAAITVPTVPIAALVLPVLLGGLFLVLRRHRAASPDDSLLAALGRPLRRRNLASLALMPLAATAIYAPASGGSLPYWTVHPVFAAATILGGTILFVTGLRRTLRRNA